MKRIVVLWLCAILLLTLVACGDRTQSYSYYEFVCEGDMTVTHGSEAATVLSDGDEAALLKLWGHAWGAGKANGTFDYEFAWENTTIRYDSARGVFALGGTGMAMKLSREERGTVETILDKYR